MVFNVCAKFHENMSSGFKVMERTRKLLTHIHGEREREREDENYIPLWHTSYAGGKIKRQTVTLIGPRPYILNDHECKILFIIFLFKISK